MILRLPSWLGDGCAIIRARQSRGRAAPCVWKSVKECTLPEFCPLILLPFGPWALTLWNCHDQKKVHFTLLACPTPTLCVSWIKMAWNIDREGTLISRQPVPLWRPLPTILLPAFLSYGSRKAVTVAQSLSHVWLFATPWTVALQAPVSSNTSLFAQIHFHWVGDATQPSHSVAPFSSCPQSFPASGSFPMSWLFTLGAQRIGA